MSMRDIFMAMALMGMNGSGVSDSQIAAAVSAYLDAHPVSAGIPIPETAGLGQTIVVKTVDAAGKPTAWETVDLPGASEVPDALPNPHTLTFTGAVEATYDGTEAVSVEIPSGGSGGGYQKQVEIFSLTITEEVESITVSPTTEQFSQMAKCEEIYIYAYFLPPSAVPDGVTAARETLTITYSNDTITVNSAVVTGAASYVPWSYVGWVWDQRYLKFQGDCPYLKFIFQGAKNQSSVLTIKNTNQDRPIHQKSFTLTSVCPFGVGTYVKIYGIGYVE